MPCVLAADPGVSGAVAVVDPSLPDGVQVFDIPIFTFKKGKSKKRRFDPDGTHNLIRSLVGVYEPDLFVLEDVNGFGGNRQMTGHAGFVFGVTFGAIQDAAISTGVRREYPPPATWKRAMGLRAKAEEGKAESRRAAMRLFPSQSGKFQRVQDHNRAEAALLAEYGLTKILGYVPR